MTGGTPAPADTAVLVVFEPGLEPVAHQFDDWPAPTPTYQRTDDVAALASAGHTAAQHCATALTAAGVFAGLWALIVQ